ncbi:MAG: TadE/TadG family type IV pilus assembly protein [Actinomycetota bacterium]
MLVEAALTMMLLVMLLVGTVTAAVAYGRSNALQTSAREGSRFGATLPLPGGASPVDSWLSQVRDVTRAAAIGDLGSAVAGQYICVALLGPAGTPRRLEETSGSTAYGNADCFTDGRPVGESRVQVLVRRNSEIQVVLFTMNVTLSSQSAARFER